MNLEERFRLQIEQDLAKLEMRRMVRKSTRKVETAEEIRSRQEVWGIETGARDPIMSLLPNCLVCGKALKEVRILKDAIPNDGRGGPTTCYEFRHSLQQLYDYGSKHATPNPCVMTREDALIKLREMGRIQT